jgi:hypothetical protein
MIEFLFYLTIYLIGCILSFGKINNFLFRPQIRDYNIFNDSVFWKIVFIISLSWIGFFFISILDKKFDVLYRNWDIRSEVISRLIKETDYFDKIKEEENPFFHFNHRGMGFTCKKEFEWISFYHDTKFGSRQRFAKYNTLMKTTLYD